MTKASTARHGRPLVMIGLVLTSWVLIRVFMWETPFANVIPQIVEQAPPANAVQMAAVSKEIDSINDRDVWIAQTPRDYTDRLRDSPIAPLAWEESAAPQLAPNPNVAGGHQMLWMAAMAHLPVPRELNERMVSAALPDRLPPSILPEHDRWSLDAWAFWRKGSGASDIAQGRVPSYGASQTAALLQYRLQPHNARDPRAYVRGYRALIDHGESELAIGVSARLLANVPLRAHAELRATERSSNIELRPAAFVTTELAPKQLPAKFRAEGYAQAGYVGGNGATAFADGQLHVLRDVKRFDLGQVSLGAAAWGGAQEGANRLDLGPSLRFDLELKQAPARLSLDYRERVAGNAEPRSGVSLMISSRF